MFELELTGVTATLEQVIMRTEGTDDVPAVTLKISCAQSADVLAFFSPTLKAHLFDTEGPRDLAEGMAVRYPHLDYPLALDHEMVGARVVIEYGIGEMEFTDAEIKDFRITPMAGGTVVVGFKVNCKPDAEKHLPKLYVLQKKGITLTLEPAELAQMQNAA